MPVIWVDLKWNNSISSIELEEASLVASEQCDHWGFLSCWLSALPSPCSHCDCCSLQALLSDLLYQHSQKRRNNSIMAEWNTSPSKRNSLSVTVRIRPRITKQQQIFSANVISISYFPNQMQWRNTFFFLLLFGCRQCSLILQWTQHCLIFQKLKPTCPMIDL